MTDQRDHHDEHEAAGIAGSVRTCPPCRDVAIHIAHQRRGNPIGAGCLVCHPFPIADPQTIGVQAGAFGVPNSIVREQPEQPRLIGGGTLPLDTLPLFGGQS